MKKPSQKRGPVKNAVSKSFFESALTPRFRNRTHDAYDPEIANTEKGPYASRTYFLA